MTLPDAIALQVFEALKAVGTVPFGSGVPHEVWRECYRAELALYTELRMAGISANFAQRKETA